MIWCRPPPRWDAYEGDSRTGIPFFFYAQKQKRRKLQMARKPKTAGRMIALLLAAVMTLGSFPVTTYAAGTGVNDSLTSASLIDDPVSGVTGSGWDNIGLGGSTTPDETSPEDGKKSSRCFCTGLTQSHSTVTDFARLRGLSTSQPLWTAL